MGLRAYPAAFDAIPWEQVEVAAKVAEIDPLLLGSVVMTESRGNPWAMRYEPAFKWEMKPAQFALQLGITVNTETELQKFSYGLCQLMGALCREMGFTGMLPQLLDPVINLSYGAKHLKKLLVQYGEEPAVAAAYNAGSPRKTPGGMYVNQVYVDKVMGNLRELRKLS